MPYAILVDMAWHRNKYTHFFLLQNLLFLNMIMKAKPEQYNSILTISEECFGLGYISLSKLKANGTFTWVCYAENNNAKIVGFVSVRVANIEDGTDILPIGYQSTLILQTLALYPEYRNLGYGTNMLESICKWAKSSKYQQLLYYAWVESYHSYFEKKIAKVGFTLLKTIKEYWLVQSINQNFECLVCGAPPCHCTINIYLKKVGKT